jgi:hypothetical protein
MNTSAFVAQKPANNASTPFIGPDAVDGLTSTGDFVTTAEILKMPLDPFSISATVAVTRSSFSDE